MLHEVGKIYARAFRMLFQHPQFLRLSVAYALFNNLISYINLKLKTFNSLGLRFASLEISLIVGLIELAISAAIPLAYILMVYQSETGIDLKRVFQQTRENFWKFVGQSLAGTLLALVYTLPVFCLVLFSVFMDNALFILILIPMWILVMDFLVLAQFRLLNAFFWIIRKGVFQNSLQGLRILNGNFAFFITMYLVTTLISTVLFPIRYTIGSLVTGIDLFSVPISSFSLFIENVFDATQTPIVYGWDIISGTILLPFYTIVLTLAYLRYQPLTTAH